MKLESGGKNTKNQDALHISVQSKKQNKIALNPSSSFRSDSPLPATCHCLFCTAVGKWLNAL